ncbi:MAG: endonuclease/exonuclease/phosphatase family protein, partial [Clostridia bacterium]|nr:endonuclease/exonuclease/phosphatase family protein [Clostridia bacterium]
MRLVSWNVNGLRACAEKGFGESVAALDADCVCLQEIKLRPEQFTNPLQGYEAYINSADKPGYSGTAVLTRTPPLNVSYGIGEDEFDHEGRVIACEFER